MTPIKTPRTALRAVPLLLAAGALLAGCSSTPVVDKATVEKEVSAQLEKQVGTAPDDITCPDDLEGEVGTTMTCTLTAGGDKIDVAVKVTDVDGTDVGFDIKVADQVQQ